MCAGFEGYEWRGCARARRSVGMSPQPDPAVVVVVAAGSGARFRGQGHKLTQHFGEVSVLEATLSRVVQAGLPVVVVTTSPLVPLAQQVVAARDIVLVPPINSPTQERLGLGYSVAAGVNARPRAAGWLVLPADMPLVRPDTLRAVLRALQQAPIARAQYQGQRSYPVGFTPELYTELSALSGDDGLRRLLSRYPVHEVEVADAGLSFDIDTWATLLAAREFLAGQASSAPP
jgi:molybdenum cofactor cytidylyltransferase